MAAVQRVVQEIGGLTTRGYGRYQADASRSGGYDDNAEHGKDVMLCEADGVVSRGSALIFLRINVFSFPTRHAGNTFSSLVFARLVSLW